MHDLAICLETVEHLEPQTAIALHAMICDTAPAVLWSAATPEQGGLGHINERPEKYWAKRFAARNMVPDFTPRELATRAGCASWYCNNLVLWRRAA